MKSFTRILMAVLLAAPAAAHPVDPDPRFPLIQIALLLDTSNSMDGLIGQAKSQLWRIVNDLAGSRCRHRSPRIEVALYEYGNSGLSAGENYIRQVVPFTNDLDLVSERLFGLTTNGGEEYCVAVIRDAARNLAWDRWQGTYKTIFIAGNEPFTQGGVNFRDAVALAVDKDIVVNTIFCGNRVEGIETRWKEGADRGRGCYMTINQDRVITVARSPYDDEIERLGQALNTTYVGFGVSGSAARRTQEKADSMALEAAPAGAAAERSLYKAKPQYSEATSVWDAVTGVLSGRVRMGSIRKDMPAEYQKMDDKKLEETLKAKAAEREGIQKKLEKLGRDRQDYLSRQASGPEDTLDKAMIQAVRSQAAQKEFVFDN